MKFSYWVLLIVMIVSVPSMMLFGVYEGIIIGIISPIFVLPWVLGMALLLAGRNSWK